jgi:cyclophilin family peptidyl-prolyl cis-trans isomerase
MNGPKFDGFAAAEYTGRWEPAEANPRHPLSRSEQMKTHAQSIRRAAAALLRFDVGALIPAALSYSCSAILKRRLAAAVVGLWATLAIWPMAAPADSFVRLDYNVALANHSRNSVFIQLFSDRPLTTNNFLQYVNAGRYTQSFMHRLAQNFVIQGGGYFPAFLVEPSPENISLDPTSVVDLDGNPATQNPTVQNEFSNSPTRSNVRGTIAMALSGSDPNSARSQWFVNLSNNSFLDASKFTVFGQVLNDSMDLYDQINATATISNLNPDTNDDGTRDAGPFGSSSTDGVPVLGLSLSLPVLPIITSATQIDYYGSGPAVNIPASGLSIVARDAFIDSGATFTGPGRLIVGSGHSLGIRDGITLSQGVLNIGTFAPGLQVGTVTLPSYQQTAEGALAIQLRGTTAGLQYDRLNVTGLAQMDGNVNVSLLAGFLPTPGNSFTVLSAGSISGTFGVTLPAITPGYVWNVGITSTAMTLTVVAADYNHDGVVDAADFSMWRDTLGTNVMPFTGADGSGNGIIDQADFTIWKTNFGETSGGSSGSGSSAPGSAGAVPEPSSIVLFGLAFAPFIISRARRACRS